MTGAERVAAAGDFVELLESEDQGPQALRLNADKKAASPNRAREMWICMRVLPHFINKVWPKIIGQKELNETNTNVGLRPIKTRANKMPHLLKQPLIASMLATLSGPVFAHSFGRLYTLPVPLWLYLYAAVATLLISFLVIGLLATQASPSAPRSYAANWLSKLAMPLRPTLRGLSVGLLLLCVVTGIWGVQDPYRNFNMTFFWIIFVLGIAYLSAFVGNFYEVLNPWRVISDAFGRLFEGRWQYPRWLGYWPAVLLFKGFIWIELFSLTRPEALAKYLIIYSAITFTGMACFGRDAWLRYGEFFAVFLRLIALASPLYYTPKQGLRWRPPFAGLQQERAEHLSLVVFILFMLSATAFDGLRGTVPWYRLFWTDPYGLIYGWLGKTPIHAFVELRPFYLAYETLCLFISPWLYLLVFAVFVWLGKLVTSSKTPLLTLLGDFGFSLIPIALVYHITHYYTLLLSQGVKIVSLMSDPFGWGWDLFGTAQLWRAPILPDMGTVWHTQVALILIGHVVSVYLAHQQALRSFGTARAALLSQVPMLVLMVLFTTAGLWILAQPIQG